MSISIELKKRFDVLKSTAGCAGLCVSYSDQTGTTTLYQRRPGNGGESPDGESIQVGCAAKLLTALMSIRILADRELWCDLELESLTRGTALQGISSLKGVTVEHLINHTHGLDGSDSAGMPHLRKDGLIHWGHLATDLRVAGRIAAPGEHHNYSDMGAVVCSAIAERIAAARYVDITNAVLSETCGARVRIGARDCGDGAPDHCHEISPAVGGCLSLTIGELRRFVHYWAAITKKPRAVIVPLPGWHPIERGVYLGWKYYGNGWFGHNAQRDRRELLIRWRADDGACIIISMPSGSLAFSPFAALTTLFGAIFPELRDFRFPQPARNEQRAGELGPYAGIYANRIATLVIQDPDEAGSASLRVSYAGLTPPGSTASYSLVKTTEPRLYLLDPAGPDFLPFVQYIEPSGGDRGGYLWNGKQLWRRLPG